MPKARLLGHSLALLDAAGIECDDRLYRQHVGEGAICLRLLRLRDIPILVDKGLIDIGIAPEEWIQETGSNVVRLERLGWYRATVSLVAPERTPLIDLPLRRWPQVRVATEYGRLAARFLRERGVEHQILDIHGSAEGYVPDLADLIVDVVETGDTLRRHGLIEVTPILACDVHLIARPDIAVDKLDTSWVRVLREAAGSRVTAAPARGSR